MLTQALFRTPRRAVPIPTQHPCESQRAIDDLLVILLPMKKKLLLFEDEGVANLLPLVFWRSVFELQIGRKIVLDRTVQRLGLPVAGVWTRDWIARVAAQRCGAPANQPTPKTALLVNGRWIFDEAVKFPKAPCVGVVDSDIAYIVCDAKLAGRLRPSDLLDTARREAALEGVARHPATGRFLTYPWEIISDLPKLLESDWQVGDASIESELDEHLVLESRDRIHVGERTRIHPTALINTTEGPVYISHDVQIGAYCIIDGPAYIGPCTQILPHAWLHGGNAIGPVCRIGGEVHRCVIHAYTNKYHTGFLGHAYVGSWVNIGAGANNSNLKNTYGKIRVPINGTNIETGLQFFGAIIADHAKLGINATIPTGAVIGLSASIAASRAIPRYIPSFSWVTDDELSAGDPLRLLDVASAAMARRDVDMTDDEVELFLDLGTRVSSFEASAR